MSDILRMLNDKDFRKEVIKSITNPQVKTFWQIEYENYTEKYRQDGIAPIQNKIGAFLADPYLNQILNSNRNDISLRRIMDEGKILIVNLSKGRIGNDSSNLLGGLITTSLALAAYSRADTEEANRKPFHVYIDEFQNFTTLSFVSMLSELRKYKVSLTFAHQYIHQLRPEVINAVFGNVGSILTFRVGAMDSYLIAKEMFNSIKEEDVMKLPNWSFYIRLMIDGVGTRVFSGEVESSHDVSIV